ncbi:type IV pilus biogenesis protein PilM [Lentibacillus sediminis]|uniref:type IV pilus biogenesis protein PilM n=1 Tax=Lentibacillus sediminis TaxID=1940529 RepID=UPI000C1BAF2B|nr:pilus assembly protein PilM [Lentibacillus sediminis]
MGLIKQGRVNIVLTSRVLRYTFNKNPSVGGLQSHGEVQLPEDTIRDGQIVNQQALTAVVRQLVNKHKWKRKKLYFAVPDDTVVMRQLQVPAALAKEEALSYVHTHLGSSIYLPFANPSIAIEMLEGGGDQRDVLLYAYPKDKLTAFEKVFTEAGLKPAAADLTSLSVYRYYYRMADKGEKHVLLINWNQDALVLTVFQRDKAIFTRQMKMETGEAADETAAFHAMNEYLTEIGRIIDFYQFSITKGEASITQLVLSGDAPLIGAAGERLKERFNLPVHQFANEELSAKYLDVLGLALKQDT